MKERAQRFAGLKKYFICGCRNAPARLKEFLSMLGPEDDIARFEYLKKSARNFGSVLIGSRPSGRPTLPSSLGRMDGRDFAYRDITHDEALAEFLI